MSSKKTPNYNLHSWEGTDLVKREEFNENFNIIDDALKPTADPSQVPNGNVGKIAQWMSWLTNRIKVIVGKPNWWDAPDITLADTKSHIDAAAPHAGHETPEGAQAKANDAAAAALSAANDYTDQKVESIEQGLALVGQGLADLEQAHATHEADYTLQVPFGGTTTNSGNNYSIASPPISALTAGMAIAVKINADSTGASTLNWNGKGAKPIKKANGTDVTNLKAGGIYTFRYDGTNFILQGEGASGNATASDLLSGKTATTDAGEIVGTMPNRGAVEYTITTQGGQYTIPAGYHNGSGKVTANISGASILKSVQRGSITVDSKVAVATVTISSIDPSKSFIVFTNSSTGTNAGKGVMVRGRIVNSTTIEFKMASYTTLSYYAYVNWEVIEFTSGVSVQRGVGSFTSSDLKIQDFTISPVDLSRSVVMCSLYPNQFNYDGYAAVKATLTSQTNLRIERTNVYDNSGCYYSWEVIQF